MINILIATDFSREAYCALYYTTRLFKHQVSKFHIVNFYGNKIHNTIYSLINEEESLKIPELKKESEIDSRETLYHIIRDTGIERDRFEIICSEKKLPNGIPELVRTKEIDLVVMGTKNHGGTLKTITGTNTTRIIDGALPVPLMIIPRELDFQPPIHIGFASELIFEFNFEALKLLKSIAKTFKSNITLIHDGRETEMSQRQWKNYNAFKNFFEDVKVDLKFSSTHFEVSRSIADFVKNNHIEMLCMSYYKHSLPGKIFREPVVENLDRHLSFPFLILPDKAVNNMN
ncbi:universal stress protein [Gramella lutea]|uniref:Universal stress protein n=1 Tax=Christiangramia lutea TaxID=1607951 RepID=A0A9X1V0D9_9FLAO|nr:universal stress protein [Christiangramia lutea]MCH4821868.1 universal stress protein [Christiangramia lutea]